MSEADASLKGASESVRISSRVKKRLQEHCRRNSRPLRQVLDKAIDDYVHRRLTKR